MVIKILKKILCISIISIFLLTSFASITVVKAEFVDQECASGDNEENTDNFYRPLAQSFTISVMALTGFEVKLKRTGDVTNVFVRVGIKSDLDGDFVENTVKSIRAISISSTEYNWFKCTFDEPLSPIFLGTEVFIVLQMLPTNHDTTIHWSGDENNPYEGGCAYKKPEDEAWEPQNDFDFNFRTYGFNLIEFDVTNNGGTIILDGTEYSQGNTVEHHSGTYTLSANIKPNYEFGSWQPFSHFIEFEDPDSITTTVTINGHGTITLRCINNPPSKPETPSGLSTVSPKQTATYTTSATDINGDKLKYGWDWDGDGDVDEYDDNNGDYYPQGVQITTSHSWNDAGTYNVKVRAKDDDWGIGEWSDPFTITVLNTPPDTPIAPDGPTQGCTGVDYEYKTKTSDPDQDKVRYGWDWDGDDNVDEWTQLYLHTPNIYRTITHAFDAVGTYYIRVKAEDEHGNQSDFSSALIVEIRDNNLPNKPTIDGPTTGKAGEEYTYTASTTDLDGDMIRYCFDWGDGSSSEWIGPYTSGEVASTSHRWASQGNVKIKVKAKDEYDAESEWSDPLSITMPRNRAINTPLLKFLQQHPSLFQLMQQFLQRLPVFHY